MQHIKWGPGVVGRTSTVAIAVIAVIGTAIFALGSAHPYIVASLALLACVMFAGFAWKAFNYAESHPDHAVMDGAEFVRHAAIVQSAKDPKIIDLKAEPQANTAPPIAISSGGENA